jgi:hypothetical protein
MRVNIYAEEMTDRVEIIEKIIDGQTFTAVRFYLYLPVTLTSQSETQNYTDQVRGPFIHRPGDDDSSAVTFWGKRGLRDTLRKGLNLLEQHYARKLGIEAPKGEHTPGPWKVVTPGHGHPTEYLCVELDEKDLYATLEMKPADAHLISAAPDMLEALEAAYPLLIRLGDFIGNSDGRCEAIGKLVDAIWKAKGVTPP